MNIQPIRPQQLQQPQQTLKTKVPDPGNELKVLTRQMQQLFLNYVNLSAALLAQATQAAPTKSRESQYEKSVKTFTCYKCGRPGHIARDCSSRTTHQPAQTTRFNTRRINYLDNKYDARKNKEAEVYLSTRARTYNKVASKSSKGQRLRKRVRTGNEIDKGDYKETYIIPAPVNAETPAPAKNRRTRRKMKPAPIENVTEFDISSYIKDLPDGLTIGQASALSHRSSLLDR